MWCRESRDPPRVSHAEPCDLHALDGGDGGEQVCMRLRNQISSTKFLEQCGCLVFSCVSVPSAPSTTQRMNPNFSFPNYQHSPRGKAGIHCTSDYKTTTAGLIE